nr:2C [potamipivirus A1]
APPFQDFNSTTLAAKNLEWWLAGMQRLWDWLKKWFCGDEQDVIKDWFETRRNEVLKVLALGDSLLSQSTMSSVLRDPDFQYKVTQAKQKLTALKLLAIKGGVSYLMSTISIMLGKLQNIPHPPGMPGGAMRMEPVGIWISGKPGSGKSSLSLSIMTGIAEYVDKHSIRDKDGKRVNPFTIFPHATGSEYFDNYEGQYFHVIDDLAQDREENDVKLICQCISSIPFSVPMANVNDKGMSYTSRVVIATTNRADFSTQVLSCEQAFKRRFQYQLWVKPNHTYLTTSGKLDLPKALEAGAVDNGHCWMYSSSGQNDQKDVLDIKQLSKMIGDDIIARVKITEQANKRLGRFKTNPVKIEEPIETDTKEMVKTVMKQ